MWTKSLSSPEEQENLASVIIRDPELLWLLEQRPKKASSTKYC